MDFLLEEKVPHGFFRVTKDTPHHPWKAKQVHSGVVVDLAHLKTLTHQPEADGVSWNWNDITSTDQVCVVTADCLPILVIGENGGAILHAGWRGLEKKIIHHPLVLATKPKFFYIGPSIQVDSFEVTSEFKDNFPNSPFFFEKNGKLYFDLQKEALKQIKEIAPLAQSVDSKICTFTNNNYNSFRRQKVSCRNWNIFSLN